MHRLTAHSERSDARTHKGRRGTSIAVSDTLLSEGSQEGDMFGILGWIIFGLVVGVVAKLLMPGRDPGGMVVTILLGIAGAVVAGLLGRALGWYEPGQPAGFVFATIGAILLLFVYRKMVKRPA